MSLGGLSVRGNWEKVGWQHGNGDSRWQGWCRGFGLLMSRREGAVTANMPLPQVQLHSCQGCVDWQPAQANHCEIRNSSLCNMLQSNALHSSVGVLVPASNQLQHPSVQSRYCSNVIAADNVTRGHGE